MKFLSKRLLPLAVVLTLIAGVAFAATPSVPVPAKWETIESVSTELSEENLKVSVENNYIYVYTSKATNVKVFTILGQLVSEASLPAGTSRLKVATRGIYILKAGSITRRITI